MIKLQHVSKTFSVGKNKIEALKDVSVEVNRGEIFGVIGYSGAGKSTLIRCVNLLERPTSGKVFVDGVDIQSLNKKDLLKLRRKIGMIFQGYNLLETANVYDNVAIPLKLEGISGDEIKARTEKYLEIVGLKDRSKAYPSQLSGGQKQRVAIARALAHEPEVLLSDEATSALDPNTTDSILELLLKVNRELGITIFLITHELDVIQRICDRVAVMDKGRIVETGSVVDVFTRPTEAMTKQFVHDEARFRIPPTIFKDLIATGKLVNLTFIGESAKDPALATMAKRYDVLPSIIAGGIDQLKDQSIGNLLVHIKGDQGKVDEAIHFLKSRQIVVEEVSE
ncbi:ATP-binding cassette domain-containing protein [Sporolactobacillus sp. THM7-4]|nr:ATP-binding cassette domain-containing protein [Sporolactobacillus sp. THM7-4]